MCILIGVSPIRYHVESDTSPTSFWIPNEVVMDEDTQLHLNNIFAARKRAGDVKEFFKGTQIGRFNIFNLVLLFEPVGRHTN